MFRVMFANRNRGMWSLLICGAGTPVGAVARIVACVQWFTITTQKPQWKRLPHAIERAAMRKVLNTLTDPGPRFTIHIGWQTQGVVKSDSVGLIGCANWDSWTPFSFSESQPLTLLFKSIDTAFQNTRLSMNSRNYATFFP